MGCAPSAPIYPDPSLSEDVLRKNIHTILLEKARAYFSWSTRTARDTTIETLTPLSTYEGSSIYIAPRHRTI